MRWKPEEDELIYRWGLKGNCSGTERETESKGQMVGQAQIPAGSLSWFPTHP